MLELANHAELENYAEFAHYFEFVNHAEFVQCVHKYRSGVDQVVIFFLDTFLKKWTQEKKMGGN